MIDIKSLKAHCVLMFALAACSPAASSIPQTAAPTLQATAAEPQATATAARATATVPLPTQEPAVFALAELGPYQVGTRTFVFEDTGRDGREVSISVWYPAIQPADSTGSGPFRDADPDASHAPYPLILSSGKTGNQFGRHLASHGFVAAGVNRMDSTDRWDLWLIDYPLDIVFALDQIASSSLDGLEGMINANQAGAMGYSFDGYNALALSGARVDPGSYLARCDDAPTMEAAPPQWWIDYICYPTGRWNEFVARAGDAITSSDDGLWQAMTDDRIRAVMPMAPEGAWLFGERGLATVDRPTLIIGATRDHANYYELEAAYIFQHLGTPDRTLISFVDQDHMMIFSAEPIARMKHLATAFFGYTLQGREDYAEYYSEDFVARCDDLAWGVHIVE